MKTRIQNYTFDASEKKITFSDYASINLEGVLLVTNVTDGIIIYNFADTAKLGTAATNVLTLAYDTTSMADTDDLTIFYDDSVGTSDSLDHYKITDIDADASPNYYGFTDKDGNWYILKETISAGADTYRYIKGTSSYTTNWTNRASLSFDYFYTAF